jgi:hypothetical protein
MARSALRALLLSLLAVSVSSYAADDVEENNGGAQERIETLRAALEPMVEPLLIADIDLRAYIAARILTGAFGRLNDRPPADRVVRFRSTRNAGYFWRKEIDCGPLGVGEVHLRLNDDPDLTVALELGGFSPTWQADRGLEVGFDYVLKAQALIRGHLDPCTGEGLEASVAVEGESAERIKTRVVLSPSENVLARYDVVIVSPEELTAEFSAEFPGLGRKTVYTSFPTAKLAGDTLSGNIKGVWSTYGTLRFGTPAVVDKRYTLQVTPMGVEQSGGNIVVDADVELSWQE